MGWLTICADGTTDPCVAPVQAAYLIAILAGIGLLAVIATLFVAMRGKGNA